MKAVEGRTFPSSSNNVLPQTPAQARKRYREWLRNQAKAEFRELNVVYDYSPTYEDDSPIIVNNDIHISRDLKRALKLDKSFQDYNWYVDDSMEKLINVFELSEKVRNNIKTYIKNKNPKDNFDTITLLLDYVDERNPPITSSEIWDQITNLKVKKEGGVDYFKDRVFKERNYDWLIVKTLSKFPPETFKIFPIIKEKYNIYIKEYPESNPIILTKALCYRELKKITKCTLDMIGLTGQTSKKYKKRFKGLKL